MPMVKLDLLPAWKDSYDYDKAIWSGLSWAVAEFEPRFPGVDLWIECSSSERSPHLLSADLYKIEKEL